jgi:hypothetical protein
LAIAFAVLGAGGTGRASAVAVPGAGYSLGVQGNQHADYIYVQPSPLSPYPLSAAVRSQDTALVRELITKGADVNFTSEDESFPPIIIAAVSGNIDMIRLLIDYRALVDKPDLVTGITALGYAEAYGYEDIGKALMDAGANPSPITPHFASAERMAEDQPSTSDNIR